MTSGRFGLRAIEYSGISTYRGIDGADNQLRHHDRLASGERHKPLGRDDAFLIERMKRRWILPVGRYCTLMRMIRRVGSNAARARLGVIVTADIDNTRKDCRVAAADRGDDHPAGSSRLTG